MVQKILPAASSRKEDTVLPFIRKAILQKESHRGHLSMHWKSFLSLNPDPSDYVYFFFPH